MDSTTIVVLCAIMVSSIYGSVMSMLNGLFLHFASAVQQQHTAVVEGDCVVVAVAGRTTVNVPRWLSYNYNGVLPPYPALIII
jgi:hypothetical protein